MRIARIDTIPIHLPFEAVGAPFIAFGKRLTGMEFLLVRVETDDGIVGWGETPWGFWDPIKSLIDNYLSKAVIGREAPSAEALSTGLQRMSYVLGRYGITMFALSAIDTALMDIAGKLAGKPLYELLGGQLRSVPTYASAWGVDQPRGEPHVRDADFLAESCNKLASSGFARIKLHTTSKRDIRIANEAVRSNVELACDAGCRLSPETALTTAHDLAELGVIWLEEPIFPPEDFVALASLRERSPIPIACGENACTEYEFRAMFSAAAVDIAQPNVNRVGGISEFRKVIELARRHDVALAAFGIMFGPGYLASLHLMSAAGSGWLEKGAIPFEASLYSDALSPVDGMLTPPTAPGLGLDPDADVVREFRINDTQ